MARWLLLLAVVAVVASAAAGAFWLQRSTSTPSSPPATERVVDLGAASVTVPRDWIPASAGDARVPGLDATAAVMEPAPGLQAYAIVVLAPSGIPPALLALLGPPGRSRATTLAGLPAASYAPRDVPGDRRAELTVARSGAGTLTVACIARVASWVAAGGCAKEVSDA